MKRSMRVLAGSILIALSPLASAQSTGDPIDTQVTKLDTTAANRGQTLVAGKIASNFNNFAGSEKNSLALVNALRNGTDAKLTYTTAPTKPGGTPTTTTVTYDPPTGKMGWGNVKISLALAQDALARAGITNPTGEQLQAALNGGSVTVKNADGTTSTVKLQGILQMRADGMGWGEIAKASGTKVGPVVSQLKMANTKVKALPPTEGTSTASTPPTAKSVTTAAGGSSPTPKSKGVTTATGGDATSGGKQHGSKGITTATGSGAGAAHGSKGITTATGGAGSHGSKGIVTADGAVSSSGPKGNGHGKGIVTAGGGSATNVAATGGKGHGAGVVTATGGNAGSGVTTANGGGNGKGQGQGNGKGKGGG